MEVADIEQVYDLLTSKVKTDLNEQFQNGRLKGTDYATAFTSLTNTIISVCVQAPKLDADKAVSESTKEVNDAHAAMLRRQTEGFDDNVNMELFKAQMSSWGMMFSSGMMEAKPDIIENDEVTSLYQSMKKD